MIQQESLPLLQPHPFPHPLFPHRHIRQMIQRILAAYAKTQELCNTLQLFSRPQNDMQICSSRPMNPMELLNDIRKFSYGENRKKLDQAVNMFAMLEMLMTINE